MAGVLTRNPPSVLDGIQLYGLPASRTELIDAYLPFHPAGQPFHRFHQAYSATTHASTSQAWWTFRFCSGARALALRLAALRSVWWAEFPQAFLARRPSVSSPAVMNSCSILDKVFVLFFLRLFCLVSGGFSFELSQRVY